MPFLFIRHRAVYLILLVFPGFWAGAQDVDYAGELISKLCSPSFHGRGYYKQGDLKSAKYIAKEFDRNGLDQFNGSWFQEFNVNINILNGDVSVRVDNEKLAPGTEFLVASSSPTLHGTFPVYWDVRPEDDTVRHTNPPSDSYFPVTKQGIKELEEDFPYTTPGAVIVRDSGKNMWWHVSNGRMPGEHCLVIIRSDKINKKSGLITVNVDTEYEPSYSTRNVAGFIRGTSQPDSFIVFTAHYDHLGRMGKDTYFPGANDNASGTAMITDLARHFSQEENRPGCSIAFIAFGGEEIGLEGSLYFANNPLLPLEKIKMLINLDMVGTGDEGITVVNGSVLEEEFSLLKQINEKQGYLKEVKSRGESCNSDHCPFYEKGVPSFFIYSRSKVFNEYHSPEDNPEKLPLNGYEGLFRLLVDFTKEI